MPVPANQTDNLPTYTITINDVRHLFFHNDQSIDFAPSRPNLSGFTVVKQAKLPPATAVREWSLRLTVVSMMPPIHSPTSRNPLWQLVQVSKQQPPRLLALLRLLPKLPGLLLPMETTRFLLHLMPPPSRRPSPLAAKSGLRLTTLILVPLLLPLPLRRAWSIE